MNKRIVLTIGILLLILLILISYIVHHQPKKLPEGVPATAVWKGGLDGGCWFELVYIKGDTIRFRFYEDYGGLLVDDVAFVPDKGEHLSLTAQNWFDSVGFFDGENVYLKRIVNHKFSMLIPVCQYYNIKHLPNDEP